MIVYVLFFHDFCFYARSRMRRHWSDKGVFLRIHVTPLRFKMRNEKRIVKV